MYGMNIMFEKGKSKIILPKYHCSNLVENSHNVLWDFTNYCILLPELFITVDIYILSLGVKLLLFT